MAQLTKFVSKGNVLYQAAFIFSKGLGICIKPHTLDVSALQILCH